MYTKILLVFIIVILSAFFYLHTMNPSSLTYAFSSTSVYELPSTMLLFMGFFAGVVIAVLNSLLVDARRAWLELKSRKEKKLLSQADENYKKGSELLVKGETAGARELIEKALKAKPNHTAAINTVAAAMCKLHDRDVQRWYGRLSPQHRPLIKMLCHNEGVELP